MKRIKPAYNVNLQDADLKQSVQRLGDSLLKAVNGLAQIEILSGTLISDVDLGTSAVRVPHKLDRKPLGYIVVRRNTASTVYEQGEEREDLFLNLVASAAVKVSLWVF